MINITENNWKIRICTSPSVMKIFRNISRRKNYIWSISIVCSCLRIMWVGVHPTVTTWTRQDSVVFLSLFLGSRNIHFCVHLFTREKSRGDGKEFWVGKNWKSIGFTRLTIIHTPGNRSTCCARIHRPTRRTSSRWVWTLSWPLGMSTGLQSVEIWLFFVISNCPLNDKLYAIFV